MKKSWHRILSLLLVLIFVLELAPVSSFAVNEEATKLPEAKDAFVVGEVEELREESVKHFRMSDGSFILVEYDEPIHFQGNNGKWQNIDNTLQMQGTKYVAKNGDFVKSFSADLADGELFNLQYRNYSVSMSLVSELNKNEYAETEKVVETAALPQASVPMPTEAQGETISENSATIYEDNQISTDTEAEESSGAVEPSFPASVNAATEPSDAPTIEAGSEVDAVRFTAVENAKVKANVENEKAAKKIAGKSTLEEMIALETSNSEVRYNNALKNTDLLYQNRGYNIKESIIINKKQDSYSYSFGLALSGLTPVLQEDGSVALNDENNIAVFEIPAPYMIDDNQEISNAAEYTLTKASTGWVITVTADNDWLNDRTRAFPVTLDPTIILKDSNNIETTYITSARKDYSGGNRDMFVGYAANPSYGTCQICAKVTSLPSIPANCTPVAAQMAFYHISYFNSSTFPLGLSPSGDLTVEAHTTTDNISSVSSLTWNALYTNGAGINDTVLDYQLLNRTTRASNEFNYWDITSVAVDWFSNGAVDSAIVLTAPNAESEQRIANLYGSYMSAGPRFVVQYRNTVGIEDYYTYQEASVGRAGDVYISDFTNQLTAVHTDLTYPSEATPFTLTHVYNSAYSMEPFTNDGTIHTCDYTGMSLGHGWKLSAMQTVMTTQVNDTTYLVYNDGDGTEHYFQYSALSTYHDEDGLGLKIIKTTIGSNTIYTMTDYGEENTWVFHNGYLISQKDSVGNMIYYAYNTNYSSTGSAWKPAANSSTNKLWQIVSCPKGQSPFTICSFGYTGSRLTSMTDYSGRTTTYSYTVTYDEGTNYERVFLDSILYPDGNQSQYQYDSVSKRMSTIYDHEGKYGLNITQRWVLGRWATNQVKEFTADSINGTQKTGNAFHAFRNSPTLTSYRFYGPDHTSETSDDVVTYYVLDHYGRTICAYDTDSDKTVVLGATSATYTENSGASKKNNRLSGAAIMGQHADNILQDAGVEIGTGAYWGTVGGSSTASGLVLTGNSSKTHTGNGALQCNLTYSAGDTAKVYMRHGVSLTQGTTYTFSGYINTNEMQSFPNENTGAYLAFYDGNTEKAKSDIINYATYSGVAGDNIDSTDGAWEKVSVSYTAPSTGDYYVAFVQYGAKGTAYCDDLQLEVNPGFITSGNAASSTNYVTYSSFEMYGDPGVLYNWSGDNFTVGSANSNFGLYSAKTIGNTGETRHLTQSVNINKPSNGLTFILSGWGKADSVGTTVTKPEDGSKSAYYGLIATIHYSDETTEKHYVSFNDDYNGWQYASGIVVPKQADKTIATIDVTCAYDYNANTAYFDSICLVREPLQTYSYDDDGNPIAATDGNAKTNCTYVSNSNRLQSYTAPSGVTHTFTYNSNKLIETEKVSALTTTMSYSTTGSVTQERITSSNSSSYLVSSNAYSDNGHFRTASIDANSRTTSYTYFTDTSRLLESVTNPRGTRQDYRYDNNNDRLAQTYIDGKASVIYGYTESLLSSMVRKSFPSTTSTTNPFYQKYFVNYSDDAYGNIASVTVSGSTDGTSYSDAKKFMSNNYESGINNGRLTKTTYANGDSIDYTYDMFDRTTSSTYTTNHGGVNAATTNHYDYSSEGDLIRQYATGDNGAVTESYAYNYDSLGRLIHSREYHGNSMVQSTAHLYDTSNRLKQQSWLYNSSTRFNQSYTYSGTYDSLETLSNDIRVAGEPFSQTITYSYNDLRQLTRKTTASGSSDIFYRAYAYKSTGNQTSAQIQYMNYRKPSGLLIVGNMYTYDSSGNIASIYASTATGISALPTQTYTYDSMGQLTHVSDNNAGFNYSYTYDTAGNIRSITRNPFIGATTQTSLSYENSIWRDLLTKVQVGTTSENITYETAADGYISGNPISYYNGTHYVFTWKNGRQLATTAVSGKNISYEYDMAGVRSSKTVDGTTYEYETLSGSIMRQTWGDKSLHFIYDDNNQPYAMVYQSAQNEQPVIYYYALNVQGDVVALMSGNTIVARYSYDPWGAVTVRNASGTTNTSSTFIGNINPLRYRGYYYDAETELYYLQSRYYDPAIGRFINADTFATTDAEGFLSCNMFAYCENDPVNRSDPNGEWVHFAVGAAIGAVVGGISAAVSSYQATGKIDILSVGIGITSGAISGLLSASGVGIVGQVLGGAAISAANSTAQQLSAMYITKTQRDGFHYGDLAFETVVGGICGLAGGNGASYHNAKSINQLGKRFMKTGLSDLRKGFSLARAWKYYARNAHAQGGSFVITNIAKNWAINSAGSIVTLGRNKYLLSR